MDDSCAVRDRTCNEGAAGATPSWVSDGWSVRVAVSPGGLRGGPGRVTRRLGGVTRCLRGLVVLLGCLTHGAPVVAVLAALRLRLGDDRDPFAVTVLLLVERRIAIGRWDFDALGGRRLVGRLFIGLRAVQ